MEEVPAWRPHPFLSTESAHLGSPSPRALATGWFLNLGSERISFLKGVSVTLPVPRPSRAEPVCQPVLCGSLSLRREDRLRAAYGGAADHHVLSV